MFLLYFLHFCHFYCFFLNIWTLFSHYCSANTILGDINSWTDKFIIFFLLNSLWNCHVLHSMVANWLLLFLNYTFLKNERRSRFKLRRRLTVLINSLVFLSKYCRHTFYIFHLLWQSGNCIPIFSEGGVIDNRADALLKDAVQVTLSIVHQY